MSSDSVITKSSHGPGRTCLAFSADGSIVYTGGSDCIVRIWNAALDASQEPAAVSEADGAITSISSSNDCWFSGSADSDVRRYASQSSKFVGLAANTPGLPVECVSVDPKGTRAAVISQDTSIRLVWLDDTHDICLLKGHTKGVRRASWHPSAALLTTCGSDGNVIVWDVAEREPKLEKIIEGVIPAVKDTEPEYLNDCTVLWHPSGHHFFAASRSREIVSVSRETWSRSFSLTDDSVSGVITALALSQNGVYLASATRSHVHVWSTQTRQLLFRQSGLPSARITQLVFSPTQNLIAWTDTDGNFSRWLKPIPDSLPDPVKLRLTNSTITQSDRQKSNLLWIEPDEAVAKGNEDDTAMDDEWIIDDIGGQLADEMPLETDQQDQRIKEMVSITKAQPPFQPGSTPMENKKRYLAYNMIGVIDVTDQDTHHIVNVDFHDRSARTGYHFTDHFKYDIGYLGDRGALFACQPENESPAHVLYKPYTTWTAQGEWTYRLRSKTRILGIAASGTAILKSDYLLPDDLRGLGNVVIATTEGDLTFLSGTGRERRIMGLGADYVSMAAGSRWLFVVHRAGATTIDGSQNLSYSLIDYEDFMVQQAGLLPLVKGHTLIWIGITDDGAPAMYDTTGRVHILTKFRIPMAATWARVMDTNLLERREGKDESYWPVGIAGTTLMCLILKGRQRHPGFPRPLVQELPIRLPFRHDAEELEHDEPVERELMMLELRRDELDGEVANDDITKREMAIDKEILRLIQIACKKDNLLRAIELVKLLHNTSSFDLAVKVADFYHLVGLREKIELLKANREMQSRSTIARGAHSLVGSPLGIGRHIIRKPLADGGHSAVISRPGLTRASPYIEQTAYMSVCEGSHTSQSGAGDATVSPMSPGGKRKRSDNGQVAIDDGLQRQVVDDVNQNPKATRPNPFARKSDGQQYLARRVDPEKIIQQNDSFFDKVDGNVRKVMGNRKDKEMREATRQTTLLGTMFGSNKHDKTIDPPDGPAPSMDG